jgi:hypothetical protein
VETPFKVNCAVARDDQRMEPWQLSGPAHDMRHRRLVETRLRRACSISLR